MYIEIHEYNVVIHEMNEEEVIEMCNEVLKINYKLFNKSSHGNTMQLKHAFGKGLESVFINVGTYYVNLHLHGSFFDNAPDFRFKKLLKFLSRFRHTPKQLDVAFVDNKKCLTKKEMLNWCRYSSDYCAGSLVARAAPKIVYCERRLDSIRFGSPKSTTNFATIYVRLETGFIRIEIKFKKQEKIEHLLENYSDKNPQQFESRCLESLVGCINFITPESKNGRGLAKDKKQPSWKSFLGSDIQKINWSEVVKEKIKNRTDSDEDLFEEKIKKQAKMVNNMIKKMKVLHDEKYILKMFAANCEYRLVKKVKVF